MKLRLCIGKWLFAVFGPFGAVGSPAYPNNFDIIRDPNIDASLIVDSTTFISFFIFAAVAAFTPGPNNLLLSTSGALFGFRRTVPHVLGVIVGFLFIVLTACLGLGWVLSQVPALMRVLQWGGVIVIGYLAIQFWNLSPGEQESRGRPMRFIEALMFQWINPKGVVVIISAISAYAGESAQEREVVAIILGVFFVVTSGSATLWAYAGSWISRYLKTGARQRWFNRIAAGALIATTLPALTRL